VVSESYEPSFQNLLENLVCLAHELKTRYDSEVLGEHTSTPPDLQQLHPAVAKGTSFTQAPNATTSQSTMDDDSSKKKEDESSKQMDADTDRDLGTLSKPISQMSDRTDQKSDRTPNDQKFDRLSSPGDLVDTYARSTRYDDAARVVEKDGEPGEEPDVNHSNVFKHGNMRKLTKHFNEVDAPNVKYGISRSRIGVPSFGVRAPDSDVVFAWNCLACAALTFDAFVLPAEVFNPGYGPINAFCTWATLVFWVTQIPVAMLTGYIDRDGTVVMKKRKTLRRYMRRWIFLDITLIVLDVLHAVRLIPALRYVRCFRFLTANRLFGPVLMRVISFRNMLMVLWGMGKSLLGIIYFVHVCSCGWWAIGYYTRPGWAFHAFGDLPPYADQSLFFKYAASVLWSFQLFGFGFVDIHPVSRYEAAYAMGAGLFSFIMLGIAIGQVVSGMLRLDMLGKEKRDREEALRNYCVWHGISQGLRNKVWELSTAFLLKDEHYPLEEKVALVKVLPKKVQLELRSEVYLPVLKVYPFFNAYSVSDADHRAMASLIARNGLNEFTLQEHEELFHEGAHATSMYFLVDGKLVYKYKEHEQSSEADPTASSNYGPSMTSDFLGGMMSLSDGGPRDPGYMFVYVKSVDWLSEAALWMNWEHQGLCTARTHVGMLAIDANKFQVIFGRLLPQARSFATRFTQFANRCQFRLSDYLNQVSAVNTMSEDVFVLNIVTFDVGRCHPFNGNLYKRSEWEPASLESWALIWRSAWHQQQSDNQSALIKAMCSDMKHNTVLAYQTMFSQNMHRSRLPPLAADIQTKYDQTVMFLKRLYICLAVCGIESSAEDNGDTSKPWPFPLATALGHGGRILLTLTDIKADEFMNVLRFGKSDGWNWDTGVPGPIYARVAATHAVKLANDKIHEIKPSPAQVLTMSHYGMDLPLGGYGNPVPPQEEELDVGIEDPNQQMYIGPAGSPYKAKGGEHVYMDQIQHGHLYMLMRDFKVLVENGPALSAILIGVEGSAPQKANLFGHKHTAEGHSNELSAFGKRKWRDYRATGQGIPADMGGIRVQVNAGKMAHCERVLDKMPVSAPSDEATLEEMTFFRHLLQASDEEALDLLNSKFGPVREGTGNRRRPSMSRMTGAD
jgi:hypothetical protein